MLPIGARMKSLGTTVFGVSLVAGATFGVAGCTSQDIEQTLGDVRDAPAQPAGAAIPFQTFTDDAGPVATTETRVLIRTAQGYLSFFGHAAPADVDFASDWVIFYGAGTEPTGGYDASIVSLTRAGKILLAVTSLVSPASDCVVPDLVTSPNIFIKFAARTGASIDFFKSNMVRDCEPCAAVVCPAGSECVVEQSGCESSPCPMIGVCVGMPTPVLHCGGIAGIQCPDGDRCVDDPSDSCDPNAGGADCGGICQCIDYGGACNLGLVFDSSPQVCKCVPATPPTSCPPVCDIFCANGNVLDASGCPTCACKSAPTP